MDRLHRTTTVGTASVLAKVRVGTTESRGALAGSRSRFHGPSGPVTASGSRHDRRGAGRVPSDGGKPEVFTTAPILAFAGGPTAAAWSRSARARRPVTSRWSRSTRRPEDVKRPQPRPGHDSGRQSADPRASRSHGGQGFLTSFASARSDIWLLEGIRGAARRSRGSGDEQLRLGPIQPFPLNPHGIPRSRNQYRGYYSSGSQLVIEEVVMKRGVWFLFVVVLLLSNVGPLAPAATSSSAPVADRGSPRSMPRYPGGCCCMPRLRVNSPT